MNSTPALDTMTRTFRAVTESARAQHALEESLRAQAQAITAPLQAQLDASTGLLDALHAAAAPRVATLRAHARELEHRNAALAQALAELAEDAQAVGPGHASVIADALDGDPQAVAFLHRKAASGDVLALRALWLRAELERLAQAVAEYVQAVAAVVLEATPLPDAPEKFSLRVPISCLGPNSPPLAPLCASDVHAPNFPAREEPPPT